MPLEGISLLSQIARPTGASKPRETPIYWAHNKGSAVRAGNWKLVRDGRKPWELYHLSKDGTELNNLAAQMPEKVAELSTLHDEWEKRTAAGATSSSEKGR